MKNFLWRLWCLSKLSTTRGGGGGHPPSPPKRSPGGEGAVAQHRCSSAPRGSSTQWATAGAPEAPRGREWWARHGKEPPTKPGWAEPRTTARSQSSVNHPGHHAGAHASHVNHDGAHASQYANYWAPLTRKRHIPPHPAQPRHTNDWAPRTRKRHQREHRPQRPSDRSDPTQHAKGRMGDCPGPRKGATTRRNVTEGK